MLNQDKLMSVNDLPPVAEYEWQSFNSLCTQIDTSPLDIY